MDANGGGGWEGKLECGDRRPEYGDRTLEKSGWEVALAKDEETNL